MASKIISIREEAYNRLKERKSGGKSFSDVIIELTGSRGNLDGFIGIWSDGEADTAKENIAKFRKKFSEDAEKREHELFGH